MKQAVILLHGALGSASHWQNFEPLLADDYELYCPDFPGHGKSALPPVKTIDELADFLADYIQEHQLQHPFIIGYSMGAYVALNTIVQDKINCAKLICIATKMDWSPEIAQAESSMLNAERLAPVWMKLQTEHGHHLNHLLDNTTSILMSIGASPLTTSDMTRVLCPCLVLRGDKDKMVTAAENQQFVKAMPQASYQEMPAQGHLLERMDPVNVTKYIRDFFA